MKRIVLVFVVVAAFCAQVAEPGPASEAEVRRKLVGTWKLVLAEDTLKDGSKRGYYGAHGKGILMYSADGYMCGEMMDPDRPRWAAQGKPTTEEKASAFDNSFGYCGRYEVDAKRIVVVHLPEVASGPAYVGSRQERPYRFEGNRMIFSGGRYEEDPAAVSWEFVWEKVK